MSHESPRDQEKWQTIKEERYLTRHIWPVHQTADVTGGGHGSSGDPQSRNGHFVKLSSPHPPLHPPLINPRFQLSNVSLIRAFGFAKGLKWLPSFRNTHTRARARASIHLHLHTQTRAHTHTNIHAYPSPPPPAKIQRWTLFIHAGQNSVQPSANFP